MQQEALTRLRAIKDTSFVPVSLTHLGYAHYFLGDYAAAREMCSQGLQESMRYKLLPWAIYALSGLGLVAAGREKREKAVTLLTFATEHPLLLSAFTLGEPGRVLAEMSEDLSADAFATARVLGQARDVGRITQLLGQDDRVNP
jgi:hypothetical protein